MVTAQLVRELLASHGKLMSQTATEWTGAFPLPASLELYYQEIGPYDITIEAHGNPFFLPSLAELWNLQAGYRWNGISGEPCPDWDDDWLVVAHEFEGAFILSRKSGKVLHDLHGGGAWKPYQLFPDLNSMAACLADLGNIVASAGEDFTEDDCSIHQKYLDQAFVRLQKFLGSAATARFALEKLSWVIHWGGLKIVHGRTFLSVRKGKDG